MTRQLNGVIDFFSEISFILDGILCFDFGNFFPYYRVATRDDYLEG